MGYHAKLSPSSASRWTSCTASPRAQEGRRDDGSEAARIGTCCHQISDEVLRLHTSAQDYVGRKMVFWIHPESDSSGEDWADELGDCFDPNLVFTHEVVVTQDMVDKVETATSYVLEQMLLHDAELHCEMAVPIGHFTGEAGATGRCDVTMLTPTTIFIKDYKYGRHPVLAYDEFIDAETGEITRRVNLQMGCYALGAYELFEPFYDFERVHIEILQPFIGHTSEYECSIEELLQLREWLRARAEDTRTNPQFAPTSDNCHFCRAGGDCAAQTAAALETALGHFDDLDAAQPVAVVDHQLGDYYAKLTMVRQWCDAVANRVSDRLRAGQLVARSDGLHYKLVPGKAGHRQWVDEALAASALHSHALSEAQIYTRSLLGPAAIEGLTKRRRTGPGQPMTPPVLAKAAWDDLQPLITQKPPEANPVIVLSTDDRAPLDVSGVSAFDAFDD